MKQQNKFFFFLVALVLFSTLAFASHVIKTSSGGSSYHYNDSTTNDYSILVNNTDTLSGANITQVNITIPGSFSFVSSSQTTDASGTTFSNTSTVLSWTNSAGMIMNLSSNLFSFSATSTTPGTYALVVTTLNATGSFTSNISVVVDDATPPSIIYYSPTTSGSNVSQNYVIFNISAQDANSSVDTLIFRLYDSSTLLNTTSTTSLPFVVNVSLSDGVYYYNVTVNDSRNNVNTTQRSITLDTTAPVITLSKSSTTTSLTLTASISDTTGVPGTQCTSNRSGSTVSNVNLFTKTITESSLSCGTTYTYNITCTDYMGYKGSTVQGFTTSSCSSSGSSGGGSGSDSSDSTDTTADEFVSFWTNTYVVSDLQSLIGYNKNLEIGHRFRIDVDNETHYVGVVKITSSKVTINVSSTPQQAILGIGESKKFEVSNDSYYDLQVSLVSINNSGVEDLANITLTKIHEKFTPSTTTSSKTTASNSSVTPDTVGAIAQTSAEGKSAFTGFFTKLFDGGNITSLLKNKWFWIGILAVGGLATGGVIYIRKKNMVSRKVKLH